MNPSVPHRNPGTAPNPGTLVRKRASNAKPLVASRPSRSQAEEPSSSHANEQTQTLAVQIFDRIHSCRR